jgi:16S rRNA C967 or C1407 C5-methylase (RsmB/RsmF family)/NOL1/NOP2/fmu family ribosome biogenesis protein
MRSLPTELISELNKLTHFDDDAFIEAHNHEHKVTSVRLNSFKPAELDIELSSKVAWTEGSFYLDSRPSFTLDPQFHAGCYYVQEAGSLFIEYLLKQCVDFNFDLNVLDLCAAPGGKSTLINSLLNENSLLVANEFIKLRADVLTQNLSKWGTANTIVTNNDPNKFSHLHNFFNVILVDAPCSGSGLFRKQPEAIDEWSVDVVTNCSIRQKKILSNVIPALKENGYLIYSTCSYSIEENESIVQWLQHEFNLRYVSVPINKDWGIVETEAGYRFYPYLTKSEGFFCAVLQKQNSENTVYKSSKTKNNATDKKEEAILENYLEKKDHLYFKTNNRYHFLNREALNFVMNFEKQFYFKKAGVCVGEFKGQDLIPNQELAWCNYLKKSVNSLELSKEAALSYLKKEGFDINLHSEGNPKESKKTGLQLITYKNYGLGWAKLLTNRINNYLPNELRILK